MITSLIAFFGSSVFRMLLGEAVNLWNKHQDHRQEVERMQVQGKLDAERHAREQEAIRTQHAQGVEVIRVQGDDARDTIGARAFANVAEGLTKLTGIKFVDVWNRIINPALATWSVCMITLNYAGALRLDDQGWAICGASLGLYLADRNLFKRGK